MGSELSDLAAEFRNTQEPYTHLLCSPKSCKDPQLHKEVFDFSRHCLLFSTILISKICKMAPNCVVYGSSLTTSDLSGRLDLDFEAWGPWRGNW